MTQVPASSHGGASFALPLTATSSPDGTRLAIDEFGDLTLTGRAGNLGTVTVADTGGTDSSSMNSHGFIGGADVNGDPYSRMGPGVGLATRQVVAPVDGAIYTSELTLSFDNTNGAAKLRLKGKTADGTVVSANIALA